MKTLKLPNQDEAYEIVDAYAREQVTLKQGLITGTAGQFVVIGDDGNVTVKTIPSAEGVSF